MTMGQFNIQYIFNLEGSLKKAITLVVDEDSLEFIDQSPQVQPDWTRLDYHQCSHCPLKTDEVLYCPVAICLNNVFDEFGKVASYEQLELQVISDERQITQVASAQSALSSLLGLMFATSGCPHTAFLKPMARFHLPLASPQETVFRASGMYLLSQYFNKRNGVEADLDLNGLRTIYENLHRLNIAIAKRLEQATIEDALKNAIVVLDMISSYMPMAIDEYLKEIEYLFTPYARPDITE